jgi:hypothetical protein
MGRTPQSTSTERSRTDRIQVGRAVMKGVWEEAGRWALRAIGPRSRWLSAPSAQPPSARDQDGDQRSLGDCRRVSGGCVEGAMVEIAERVIDRGRPELAHFGIADLRPGEWARRAAGKLTFGFRDMNRDRLSGPLGPVSEPPRSLCSSSGRDPTTETVRSARHDQLRPRARDLTGASSRRFEQSLAAAGLCNEDPSDVTPHDP